jgi:antagonist of KipI
MKPTASGSSGVEEMARQAGGTFDAFEVVRPGLLTTVQDLGRIGYQKYGVPISGAMDQISLRAANLLVGNEEGAAGLEATGEGPALRILAELIVAIVGADMNPLVDGRPIECGRASVVRSGQVLELGRARRGLRAYLAVSGGIDVPLVLGSRSTYLPAAFGGFRGRALREGDLLAACACGPWQQGITGRRLPREWREPLGEVLAVRVTLGPQDDRFTPEGIHTFLNETYHVAPEMDRMGMRLEGPRIAHRLGEEIISDSIPLGAIQIPPDGRPIILLADRQTTGGYAKIAVAVKEDISRLAQAGPGQGVQFRRVSVEEAQAGLKRYEARLHALRQAWRWGEVHPGYLLRLGGRSYRVGVEEGGGHYRVRVREQVSREPGGGAAA